MEKQWALFDFADDTVEVDELTLIEDFDSDTDYVGKEVIVQCLSSKKLRRFVEKGSDGCYPATVLRISDDVLRLKQAAAAIVDGHEFGSPKHGLGRGFRQKRAAPRLGTSDEEDEMDPLQPKDKSGKKKKAAVSKSQAAASAKMAAMLQKSESSGKEKTDQTHVKAMQKQITELTAALQKEKEENEALQIKLDSLMDLRQTVKTLKKAVETLQDKQITRRTEPMPITGTPRRPTGTDPVSVTSSPSTTQAGQVITDDGMAQIGTSHAVKMQMSSLKRCKHQDYRRLTTDLMTVVFSREEMATHSLSGQRAANQEVGKPKIDPDRMEAIREYVMGIFPDTTYGDMNRIMTTKLNNEGKMMKREKPMGNTPAN